MILGRYRVVLCLATLAMVILSWTLWIQTNAFPRVPFVRALGNLPNPIAWGLFVCLIGGLIGGLIEKLWRPSLTLAAGSIAILILQDQHRFQPWAYQFLITSLVLILAGPALGLRLTRLFFIALYVHSGLSKLDYSFTHELGLVFLNQLTRSLNLTPQAWPERVRQGAILAMPVCEMLVGLGLAFKPTRAAAVVGAVVMHLLLVQLLGPWGMHHSTIVLVWNLALMAEVVVLFITRDEQSKQESSTSSGRDEPRGETGWAGVVGGVGFVVLVAILPLGERFGVFDSWPSFAVYASHVERTNMMIHDEDLTHYPGSIREHGRRVGVSSWQRIDLTSWSRAVRGVPVYPQNRACGGLAEALAIRYGGKHPIWVEQLGRAAIWTGDRSRTESFGLEAIREQGRRYRLNSHPARAEGGD